MVWKRWAIAFAISLSAPAMARAEFEAPSSAGAKEIDPFRPRLTWLKVRAAVGYDSNPLFVPDLTVFTGHKASGYSTLSAEGGIRVPVNSVLTVGVSVASFKNFYFSSQSAPASVAGITTEFSDYNVLSVNPVAFATLAVPTELGATAGLTASYGFRHDTAPDNFLSFDSHQLGVRAFLDWIAKGKVWIGASRHTLDFKDTPPGLPNSNRDGTYTSWFAGAEWYFDGFRRSIALTASRDRNAAKGIDWRFDGFTVGAEFKSHVVARLYGTLGITYADRDYDGGFIASVGPPGRTFQKVTSVAGRLVWIHSRDLTLDAFVIHDRFDANLPQFEGERTRVGVGATYALW